MFMIKTALTCKHSLQAKQYRVSTHAITVKATQKIITQPNPRVTKGSSCYLPRTQPGLSDIGTEPSAYQPEPELVPLLPEGLAA